jgi:hypothetical protein
MPKTQTTTKARVYDAAGNVKPYVDRAMSDAKLREDVMSAVATAREVYNDLLGGRNKDAVTLATKVATDEELREKLRGAIDDLRSATVRLQGKKEKKGHTGTILLLGIVIGILFNPVTGPDTRKWLKDAITGGEDEFGGEYPSANGGV